LQQYFSACTQRIKTTLAKWNSPERDFISEMRWNEWTGRKMRWDENDEMDEMANDLW